MNKNSLHKENGRLFVTVKTSAREDRIEEIDTTHFFISVKVAPRDGKANDAVICLLARHLGVARSLLRLKSGGRNRNKVFSLYC